MDILDLATSVDVGWTLVAAALVFFMQAGFAMVETGFTRAKNAGNIIMKNLMDFSLGTPIFWILGFGIMFGAASPFFGGFDFFADGVVGEGYDWTTLIFQTVFCATAATIVSGSMAERTKFSAYCIYSMVISAVIYPVSGHWIWGGGWLAELGFHDFAGSTAVHMVGGVAALIGAAILGPRIGKYTKDGKARAIPGHSLTLGALGCFILWFCWFGFNGGSTVALSGGGAEVASRVFVTTNMAAAVATVTVMCITWIRYKKPDVSMTLNGSLAGLGSSFAALFGVLPNTSFSQNVGLVTMTKVVNRGALSIGAIFLILCGLIPKLGAIVSIMPQSVLGGAAVMMFSSIVISGIQLITKEEMTPRNLTIVSVALGVGYGMGANMSILAQAPQAIQLIFGGSGIVPAAFVAIILNILLPKDK